MTNTNTLPPDLNAELLRAEAQSDASIAEIKRLGLKVDLGPWLTIASYAKKYDLSTQVISNWIKRGTIPADCVEDLPELNNIRLVKDQVYK